MLEADIRRHARSQGVEQALSNDSPRFLPGCGMLQRNERWHAPGKRVSLLFLERFVEAGDDKLHAVLLKHTGLRLPRAPAYKNHACWLSSSHGIGAGRSILSRGPHAGFLPSCPKFLLVLFLLIFLGSLASNGGHLLSRSAVGTFARLVMRVRN